MGRERRLREQLEWCVWVRATSPARRKVYLRTQPSCLGRRVGQGPASLSEEGSQGHASPPQPCNQQWAWRTWAETPLGLHPPRPHTDPPPQEAPQLCTSAGTWEGHRPGSRSPRLPLPRRAERARHRLGPSSCRTHGWRVGGTALWMSTLSSTNGNLPAGFLSGFKTGAQGP